MEGISADEKCEEKGEMEIDKLVEENSEVELGDCEVEGNQVGLDKVGKDTPMSEEYEIEDKEIRGKLEEKDEKGGEVLESLERSRVEEILESDKIIDKMEIDVEVIVGENKECSEEHEAESEKLKEPAVEIDKELIGSNTGKDVMEDLRMPVDENPIIVQEKVEGECRDSSKADIDNEGFLDNKAIIEEEAVKMHIEEKPIDKIEAELSEQIIPEKIDTPLEDITTDHIENLNQDSLVEKTPEIEDNKEELNEHPIEDNAKEMQIDNKLNKDASDDSINEDIKEPLNIVQTADIDAEANSMTLDVSNPLNPDEELKQLSEDASPDNSMDSAEKESVDADIKEAELPKEPSIDIKESDLTKEPSADIEESELPKEPPTDMEENDHPNNLIEEAKESPAINSTPQTPILEDKTDMDLDPKALEVSDPLPQKPSDVLRDQFSYYFDSNLTLKHTETNESFKFVNQKHYEQLGKCVQQYIQQQMSEKYGLLKVKIPECDHSQSYIYISKNFTSPDNYHKKALLLIQGAGAVRPGIWARSVCINESLKTGSMLPFLSFAEENQYEVIIFNPNKHYSKKRPIRSNDSLERHGKYVWENFIRRCNSDELYIVAHSCGGISTVSLMNLFWEEFKDRVKGVAFTDAVHGYYGMNREKVQFLRRYAVDWVASSSPRDTKERGDKDGVVFVSSGHRKHEYTTGYAYPSIVEFFKVIDKRNPYLMENKGGEQKREVIELD